MASFLQDESKKANDEKNRSEFLGLKLNFIGNGLGSGIVSVVLGLFLQNHIYTKRGIGCKRQSAERVQTKVGVNSNKKT